MNHATFRESQHTNTGNLGRQCAGISQSAVRAVRQVCLVLASLPLFAAGGCSGEGATGLAHLQQFETEAVQRFCARVSACCSELSYAFSEAGCEQLNGNSIVQFFNFQAFPGSQYDPVAAKLCLDGIGTAELGCSAKGDYQSADCKKVFFGTVPLGGKCSRNEGCATAADGTPTRCDLPFASEEDPDPDRTGVCVLNPPLTEPHGNAGDACTSTCDSGFCATQCSADRTCATNLAACYVADGLFCSQANTCVPVGVSSDPCNGSPECGPGTYCDLDLARCETLRQTGATCNDGLQCDTGYCSGTCAAQPRANADYCLGHIPPPPNSSGVGGAAPL